MGGVIQHMDWGVEGENVRWSKEGARSRQHWCNTVLHGNRERKGPRATRVYENRTTKDPSTKQSLDETNRHPRWKI